MRADSSVDVLIFELRIQANSLIAQFRPRNGRGPDRPALHDRMNLAVSLSAIQIRSGLGKGQPTIGFVL